MKVSLRGGHGFQDLVRDLVALTGQAWEVEI